MSRTNMLCFDAAIGAVFRRRLGGGAAPDNDELRVRISAEAHVPDHAASRVMPKSMVSMRAIAALSSAGT
jgi:hypothetical protein